jgi:hypothetical protein
METAVGGPCLNLLAELRPMPQARWQYLKISGNTRALACHGTVGYQNCPDAIGDGGTSQW